MQDEQQQPRRVRGVPFVKGDPRINRKGAPRKESFRAHFDREFDDPKRRAIARTYARKAAKGSIPHLEVALRLLGEGQAEPAATTTNIFAAVVGSDTELLRRLSAAYAASILSNPDAVGMGEVRQPGDVAALAPPDAGE